MTEKYQPIPHRLKNMTVGGHVAGAIDIIDDALGRNQEEVNAAQDIINKDTYRKEETYSKEETGELISRTPETDVVPLAVQEGDTVLDTLNNVPLADRPNKLFRVKNDNNTAYSEYGWTGSAWALLAEKDYGIDDEPVKESDNLLRSGGVAEIMRNEDSNSGYVYLLRDAENRILLGIKTNGNTETALGISHSDVAQNWVEATVDAEGKVVSVRRADGTLVENRLEVQDIILGEEAENVIKEIASSNASSSGTLVDNDGWVLIQSDAEKAVLEKGKTMIDLLWTPKRDVPKDGKVDVAGVMQVFEEGTPVTGIPYSGTQEIDKVVGYDVSIETFMTAVNNPYSLLYTECIRSDEQQYSAYGVTYHGIQSAGAYMGSVCSEHSGYVTGLPMPSKTYTHRDMVGEVLGKSLGQTEDALQVGDIIWTSGHCIAIEGVKRSESGGVTGVIVSEQAGAHTKTRRIIYEDLEDPNEYILPDKTVSNVSTYKMPFSDDEQGVTSFMSKNILVGHVIYRNLKFSENTVKYKWDVDGEYPYNNDICTFQGDKACFREGALVVLNYNLDENETYDWTEIEVYKDNELYETIILSEIDNSQLDERIQYHAAVLGTDLPHGDYKARMKNEDSYSDYTHFKVIQTVASYTIEDNNLECLFSSENSNVVGIRACQQNGAVEKEYYVSDEEAEEGKAVINIDGLPSDCYLKVYYECEYGRVTNEPIPIEIEGEEDDSHPVD